MAEKQHTKMFLGPISNGYETVYSKHYFLKKLFLSSYLENGMRSAMK